MDELQIWVWRRGWRLRVTERLSAQHQRILIVKPGVARGFQIEVPFGVDPYEFRQPGIWIYGLIARSEKRKACYIGQTTSVMRRLAEHAKRSRPDSGSDALFHWSDQNNTVVHVVLLELCRSEGSKGMTARRATTREGVWLRSATDASYQTPGVEKWGRLPHSPDQTQPFHETKIWQAAKPLVDVVLCSPPLKRFWLGQL
jgi:hypothetical protein